MKVLFAVILLVAAGLALQLDYGAEPEAPLQTAVVQERPLRVSLAAPGTVISLQRAEVTGLQPGRLLDIGVEEGQLVEQGDVLARLDEREAAAWKRRAEAVVQLQSKQVRYAERTLGRLQSVSRSGGESLQHIEDAQSELESARARRAVAAAELELAGVALDEHQIEAPFSGTVLRLYKRAGEWLAPGQPLLAMADLSTRLLEASIEGSDVDALRIGQVVWVSAEGHPGGPWEERILWIAPAAERDGLHNSFRVRVSLGPLAAPLRIGQQVDLDIVMAQLERALTLPIEAVDLGADGARVATLVDGRIRWRGVELGIENYTHVQILQGLRAGQAVVVPASAALRNGRRGGVGDR